MIAGLDSSQPPTAAQVAAARAAGVGLWSGYLATQGAGGSAFGLRRVWSQAEFDIARSAGGVPIAFCSGWDDPAGCRELAAAWKVRLCLDVEAGIRPDGLWVQSWLDASGAGLYGVCGVHSGRLAAFHVLAWYVGPAPPGSTWYVQCLPEQRSPRGWQWQGSHQEFGMDVDRGQYDDWFGASIPQGGAMLARNPDTTNHPRRFDACFVRADGHVIHLFSENGMVGLAQEQNLIDLGMPSKASAIPGPAWCIWEDASTLTFVVEAMDGSLWMRQEDITGKVLVDWSVFGLSGQEVGLGIPGPVGPQGPPGPVSTVVPPHSHPVNLTGTSGSPV